MGYDSTIPQRNYSVMERLRYFRQSGTLDELAARYNTPEFIAADPVQFPRRFTSLPDVEVTALLCSTIAWGNRKMICRDCERLLALLGGAPADFVLHGDPESLPDGNVHRTFFVRNLRYYLRGLRRVYARHGSLQAFAAASGVAEAESPAWRLAEALSGELAQANDGVADPRCLPANLGVTALKRLNMALRWLVRDDGIVDIGCWEVLKPAQLSIPLDVHAARTARLLGLLERRSNDRKAVAELTANLRALDSTDPARYDFALFGAGVTGYAENFAHTHP